jgi:hypothetical protein
VRDGALHNGETVQVLLCIFDTLGNSFRNFLALAQAVATDTVLVTHHNNGGETECTTTFGHFGYALDTYEAIHQLQATGLNFLCGNLFHL